MAAIKFDSYRVDKIIYQINYNFVMPEANIVNNDLDFNINVDLDRDHNIAVVTLGCIINNNFESANKPLYLEVVLQGIFTFESDIEEKFLENLLTTNAVAIIFPYMRAIVGNISVNSGIPPIILPIMNVVELLKQQKNTAKN